MKLINKAARINRKISTQDRFYHKAKESEEDASFAFGILEKIVAITTSCLHATRSEEHEKLGALKTLNECEALIRQN